MMNIRYLRICGLATLFVLIQLTNVHAADRQASIAEFAKCSRQCTTENEQCRKKQTEKCSNDKDCFESCDIAYPDCMAKCPRPGG